MNGKERMTRILKHEPVDRIALFEHFWSDTRRTWAQQGKIREDESLEDRFGFDMAHTGNFNMIADLDFKEQVVEETEDTIVILNGNGATLRHHKKHNTTPEHIGFKISCREEWEDMAKPLLTKIDERRIPFEAYAKRKAEADAAGRFLCFGGINVFENIHPLCGHVNMLMGMADDPDWVLDMAMTYSKLNVELQKILFERCGKPDGMWYYEDMGYKGSPFMSPRMYRELIKPAHVYTINYAKSIGLPVIMHSCGYVEPLLPDMIDAGIDCLQALEVKAGMDLLKLHKLYGDRISFMGGIDVRALYTNDRAKIDAELESKIPIVKQGYNYILHSDHSIPNTVDFETYEYFVKRGLELGTY